MTTPKWTVLVTTRFFDSDAVAYLESQGCRVVTAGLAHDESDEALSAEDLRAQLSVADAWIVGLAAVDAGAVRLAPRLRIVARRGVGYDRVDLAAVSAAGGVLTITPNTNTDSVADYVVGMMLAAGMRIAEGNERLKHGDDRALISRELSGKTVGIVGIGRVGRAVAKRLRGFDVRLLGFDPYLDAAAVSREDITPVGMDDLLAESDFVSLHVPLNDETRNLMDGRALGLMKRTAILVNCARGGLIDESALLDALQNGKLGGAALDVFAPDRASVRLLLSALPNVVTTAHSAGSGEAGLAKANLMAASCVVDVLNGRTPPPECVVAPPASAPR